ncbi:hypothetical protein EUTSA_v10024027mg, partial [Eutrema salsugineum]
MPQPKKKKKARHRGLVGTSKFARVAAAVLPPPAGLPPSSSDGRPCSEGCSGSLSPPQSSDVVSSDLDLSLASGSGPSSDPGIADAALPTQFSLAAASETTLPAVEGPSSGPDVPSVGISTEASLEAQTSQHRNWSSVVQSAGILDSIGTPTTHVSGVPFVMIPDANIESAKEEFKDFVFARFHNDAPDMGRIIGVVNAIWARSGPRIFVHKIGLSVFLLRVTNQRAREIILSRNMWNIAGFPMFVAPWSPEFSPEAPPLTSAVVPVEFRNVPYLLFNKESLSRIATAVGKPVKLAPKTERKENFEVARVFVCIDLQAELPSKVMSGFSNGKETLISVSYPWMPVKCSACGRYGHAGVNCHTISSQPSPTGRTLSRSPTRGARKRIRKSRSGRSLDRTKHVDVIIETAKDNAGSASAEVDMD